MASPSGASGQFASEAARDYSALVSSSSPSSHSLYSDDGQREIDQNDQDPDQYHHQDNAQDPICPWRNRRFHHQECSRYFDCPSHTIERSLSESGSGDQESTHSSHHSRTEIERDQSGHKLFASQTKSLHKLGSLEIMSQPQTRTMRTLTEMLPILRAILHRTKLLYPPQLPRNQVNLRQVHHTLYYRHTP